VLIFCYLKEKSRLHERKFRHPNLKTDDQKKTIFSKKCFDWTVGPIFAFTVELFSVKQLVTLQK